MPQPCTLSESRATLVAEAAGEGGLFTVQLIDPGWGSSGHYSPELLAEAAQQRVFAAGTRMFAGHPSPTGADEDAYGNRSVRDLWAVLASDATVNESGALVAQARVFAPYRELVAEMRNEIGLSIRAAGTAEVGEAEGRSGQIITSLDEAISVDFVVAAGRGGRILAVAESGRAHAAEVAEALPGDMTADQLRGALHDLVRTTYAATEDRWAYVEDFTDTDVIFRTSGDNVPSRMWRQAYVVADGANVPSLSGAPVEVRAETRYVPVDPAGQSTTTTESQEDTMPQIEEARLRQLEADAGRVQALEAERTAADQRAQAAERELAEARARDAARPIVTQILGESQQQLPAAVVARVTESVVAAAPLTDAGVLDEAALRTAAETARTAAEAEVAAIAEALGAGKVRGLGSVTSSTGGQTVTREESDAARGAAFGRTGSEG